MILFFDTETTGLPKNWKAPVSDLNNWPRMVQLAYIANDYDGNLIKQADYLIRPKGFTIPSDTSSIHGITTERASRDGRDLMEVLSEFWDLVEKADYLVAHNISFDEKIVGAEFLRNKMSVSFHAKKKICTMESATNFCAISGKYGYKWPKLSELHFKLFNSNFEEAHNAAVDIKVTAKCFWELKKKGVISISTTIPGNTSIIIESKSERATESNIIKKQIHEYCLLHEFKEIPLAAKAEAIMHFEFKCKQVSTDTNIDEEFEFLRDYWRKNESNLLKQTLNSYQSEFILSIKKEIIDDHKSFSLFTNEKNKNLEDKISKLEVLSLIRANDTKKFRDLVIQLYYFYLIRYKECLPAERKPKMMDDKKQTGYSNYSLKAKTAHKNFEEIVSNYSSVLEKTNNGGIPETIYTLVANTSKELEILKSEVGNKDELYLVASSKIVKYSTNVITQWIQACSNVMYVPIQGMKYGNNLFDICILTFDAIDKIETDVDTKKWFSNIKVSFDQLKKQSEPKSGCYIATMTYGDYNHPQVLILRHFRDKNLLTNTFGRVLVRVYYALSPKFVLKYGSNQVIKYASKKVLDIFIKYFLPRQ